MILHFIKLSNRIFFVYLNIKVCKVQHNAESLSQPISQCIFMFSQKVFMFTENFMLGITKRIEWMLRTMCRTETTGAFMEC